MFQPAPRNNYIEQSIFVENTKLIVNKFIYLGSTLSNNGSLDNEIISRIQMGTISFGKLEKRVWSSHSISIPTKISVYKACVMTSLLYGSETWTTYRSQIKTLERFHQRFLRRIIYS